MTAHSTDLKTLLKDPSLLETRAFVAGEWVDADDGKTYESSVTLVSSGTLNVRGCMGSLCAGEDWTR